MTKSTAVNPKNLLKFILGSAFGVLMFLVPIPREIPSPHCWISSRPA